MLGIPLGLFLSNRYLLNGLKKIKNKKTFRDLLWCGLSNIENGANSFTAKKNFFFCIFQAGRNFSKNWGPDNPMLSGCLFCPQYTFFCVQTYLMIHRKNGKFIILKTGYLKLEKLSFISEQWSFKIAQSTFSWWKNLKNRVFEHMLWKIGTFGITKR